LQERYENVRKYSIMTNKERAESIIMDSLYLDSHVNCEDSCTHKFYIQEQIKDLGTLFDEAEKRGATEYKEKWNCKLCRLAYERGGCPSHGPSLTSDVDG